jgi:hypothetical protein
VTASMIEQHSQSKTPQVRFRLRGLAADVINSRGCIIGRNALERAINEAAIVARAGMMVAHVVHPQRVDNLFGPEVFCSTPADRAAMITDCFLDALGVSWWDYLLMPTTPAGAGLFETLRARAPIGTSFVGGKDWVAVPNGSGPICVVKKITFLTNDIVCAPAAGATIMRPIILPGLDGGPPSELQTDVCVSGYPFSTFGAGYHFSEWLSASNIPQAIREVESLSEEQARITRRAAQLRAEIIKNESRITTAPFDQPAARPVLEGHRLSLSRELEADELRLAALGREVERRSFLIEHVRSYLHELEVTQEILAAALHPEGSLKKREIDLSRQLIEAEVERGHLEQLQSDISGQLSAIECAANPTRAGDEMVIAGQGNQ